MRDVILGWEYSEALIVRRLFLISNVFLSLFPDKCLGVVVNKSWLTALLFADTFPVSLSRFQRIDAGTTSYETVQKTSPPPTPPRTLLPSYFGTGGLPWIRSTLHRLVTDRILPSAAAKVKPVIVFRHAKLKVRSWHLFLNFMKLPLPPCFPFCVA